MNLLKELPELIKHDVITEATADRIRDYYKNTGSSSTNRLFVVFGVIGAILVGLGVILIIAHNWDELARGAKTFFAFVPLLSAQVLCGYILLKRQNSTAWKESGTAFLFFAVGASIALVSQIYHIPGGSGTFILTWMVLCLPLIYLMKSSIASLLYISGITYYATSLSYWVNPSSENYLYWLLLLGVLPHYYQLYKNYSDSNFTILHNWAVPLSIIITLGTIAKEAWELVFIAYFSLFGIFYLLGDTDIFTLQKSKNSIFKSLGSFGTAVLLLTFSFDWFWDHLRKRDFQSYKILVTPEFFVSAVLSISAGGLLYWHHRNKSLSGIKPLALTFILFIATFIIGLYSSIAVVLINLFVLAFGILNIRDGAKQDHLGILNYGLLVITTLVICRFFDTDLSFIIRGVLFVLVGIGFFAVNYQMLHKRKTNGQ